MLLLLNESSPNLARNQLNEKRLISLKAIAKTRCLSNVISSQKRAVAKTSRKKYNESSDIISEEKEYQKKLQWLKDHGDMTGDEGKNSGAGSSDESSSN